MNWDWISTWITTTPSAPLGILLTGVGIYLFLLLCVRLAGLRSFAKMSSFDFAITVAMGSLLAATIIARNPPLLQGVLGLAVLFGMQYLVSRVRQGSSWLADMVDNSPLLLMAGSEVISENLERARMTEGDLRSKLRLAGVTHPDQVLAVVMETTGDVSVLKTSGENGSGLDLDLFAGVRDAERLKSSAAAGRR